MRVAFVGDALSAAGYRLAGAATHVPDPGTVGAAMAAACAEADLVLVAAAQARELPDAVLDAARERAAPLVLIVADVAGHAAAPPLAQRLWRVLGAGE